MISIKLQGGLGNQLFMMAFLVAYAEKHRLEYVLPNNVENPHSREQKKSYGVIGLNYCQSEDDSEMPKHITAEPCFEHHEFPKIDNTTFLGYFQSEKYFNEKTIETFALPWKNITDWCAVHVRRDDYLKWEEYHPPVTIRYITEAMDLMKDKAGIKKFRFFSDDIDWCKQEFKSTLHTEIDYSEGKEEVEDLSYLSSHKFIIGSNSAYSLWGYYLNQNKNKLAIFPKDWFGPKLPHNTKDVYPKGAIVL